MTRSYAVSFTLAALISYPMISLAAESSFGLQCKETSKRTLDACLVHYPNEKMKCHNFARACQSLAQIEHETFHTSKQTIPASPSPVVETPPATVLKEQNTSLTQYFFIRADQLDNPYPGLTVSSGQALGASASYTYNYFVQSNVKTKTGTVVDVSSSQSLTLSGLTRFAFVNPEVKYGWSAGTIGNQNVFYVPSLWVSSNGNWDNPKKAFGDASAIKFGPELDFALIASNADYSNYFGVAPFYQTDIYSQAQAEGATFSWTPVYRNLFLGAPPLPTVFKPTFVDGFLLLRADATYLNVDKIGETNLTLGSHEWLGGATRAYLFFFPTRGGTDWSPYIADKVSLIGTIQSYWDANSKATATMRSVTLQYKLTCDANNQMTTAANAKVTCTGGSPSVALQYDWGVDRDTLVETKKVQLKLTYAY